MVWYNLKVGNWSLKYTPIKPTTKTYPYCDSEGNILTRTSEGEKSYFYVDESGKKHEQAFRLINDKPFSKLTKTKEVTTYKEVDLIEVDDLLTEKVYIIECDLLKNELEETGKALKFGFTNGNGFKVFKAYVYPSKIYKDFLFMKLGTTQVSEVITEMKELQQKEKQAENISLAVEGIDRAKVEDLIQI